MREWKKGGKCKRDIHIYILRKGGATAAEETMRKRVILFTRVFVHESE